MDENEYIDMPVDGGASDGMDNTETFEAIVDENNVADSEDIMQDTDTDTENDTADLSDRLDVLIDTLASSNKQSYFNDTLGFYVFPDLDTLLLYYPPEDNDLTEWTQTTDGNWVRLENLEVYESYIFEQSENNGQEEAIETANTETLENISVNLERLTDTISGNSIEVSDNGAAELLQQVLDGQDSIHTEMAAIYGLVAVLFLVVVVDYIQRCAKRIIKNFMRGGGDNND